MGLATNILLRGFSVRKLLWWLIAGSPGGPNRARILMEIHNRPSNAHQLSERLNLNYKTVRHHLKKSDKIKLNIFFIIFLFYSILVVYSLLFSRILPIRLILVK